MKNSLSSNKLFGLALMILIVSNIVVLFGVYFNRSGELESTIVLTERELPYRTYKENSGLSLQIFWKSLTRKNSHNNYTTSRSPIWLNEQKLETLGFELNHTVKSDHQNEFRRYTEQKELFIVLEYNGDAYKESLIQAKSALKLQEDVLKLDPKNEILQKLYKKEQIAVKSLLAYETRLYAIDADMNAQDLKIKYPDSSKYIITKALIKPRYDFQDKEIYGYISHLSVNRIYVPLKYRKMIDSIVDIKQSFGSSYYPYRKQIPRFTIGLAYGKRFEPWILSVKPLTVMEKER